MNGGIRWFHSGAFSPRCRKPPRSRHRRNESCKAQGDQFIRPEYRANSETIGLEKGQEMIGRIVENVDALIGKAEIFKGLGIKGPDVGKKSKLDTDTFFDIEEAVTKFHNIKMVATTLKRSSTNRHD